MGCIRDKGVDMTPYAADNGGSISVCIHNRLYSVKLRSVALFSLISMCMTRRKNFIRQYSRHYNVYEASGDIVRSRMVWAVFQRPL